MVAKSHDAGTRVQALALAEYGAPTKVVADLTGLSTRSINRLRKTARERGYDPEKSKIILTEYVADAPRSGRPKTGTPDKEEAVLNTVKKDCSCYGREMSTAEPQAPTPAGQARQDAEPPTPKRASPARSSSTSSVSAFSDSKVHPARGRG